MNDLPEILGLIGTVLFWGVLIWGIAKLCSSSGKKDDKNKKKKKSKKRNKTNTGTQRKRKQEPIIEMQRVSKPKPKKRALTPMQRAVLMKEVLDPPRATRPYRHRWPR